MYDLLNFWIHLPAKFFLYNVFFIFFVYILDLELG